KAEKAGGRDPKDFKGPVGQGDFATNDIHVPPVFALPKRVADDHARRAATSLIIRRSEDAAQRRPYAQHVEKVAAHPKRTRETSLAARREIEAVRAPPEDAAERLLSFLALLP